MNLLASPLPDAVDAGGASIPVRTGFRTGIQVARTFDSGLSSGVIGQMVLSLYMPGARVTDIEAAIERCVWFFRCGKPKSKSSVGRVLDWDHDADTILADFQREYGITLTDPATRMHWWVFMALFRGLSADSGIQRAMYYRSPRPRDLKGDAAARFDELARTYALPPKTLEEAIAAEAAMWGDDDA